MEEINLKEVWYYFKTKWVWIALTCILIMLIGNIYAVFFRTPMYKSSTTIVLVSENKENYSQSDLLLNKNLVSTYSEIIKSRKVVSRVINNLNLDYTLSELSNNITVESVEDTEVIKITVADAENTIAARITNELANVFTDEVKDIYNLENISILDKASVAKVPYNVNFIKDSIIYLLAGIILSGSILFVIYYFDTSIKSIETVEEKLGLTILGIVPKENKE